MTTKKSLVFSRAEIMQYLFVAIRTTEIWVPFIANDYPIPFITPVCTVWAPFNSGVLKWSPQLDCLTHKDMIQCTFAKEISPQMLSRDERTKFVGHMSARLRALRHNSAGSFHGMVVKITIFPITLSVACFWIQVVLVTDYFEYHTNYDRLLTHT